MKRSAQLLADILKANKKTIAFAESVTCGLASHTLGGTSDASEFLMGCIVCYSETVKCNLLKISPALIKKYTAESQQASDALAKNLRKLIDADIYASVTGLASPGGSETSAKPVGTIFFSVIHKSKIYNLRKRFYGSPLMIKKKACDELYKFILKVSKK